jgi:3-oxoacyl-[acyl-carrier protein] reductase
LREAVIDPGLRNKVVLVTGANSPFGIGAAIAGAFAAQGAAIFITYLRSRPEEFGIDATTAAEATTPGEPFYRARNAEAPDAVLGRLCEQAVRIGSAEIDLADPEVIPRLFDRVEETLGPVDILINNAAHSVPDGFSSFAPSQDDWAGRMRAMVDASSHDRHFALNSRAVALLMAEYARRHVSRGAGWGRIINISTDGADCFPGEVSYGASKAALESYSRSGAMELGPYGITVNVVAPGPIQSGWIPAEAEEPIVEEIPLGRMGRPDDVADVVVFLASEQARWVTGQRLFVGGGHRG